MGEMETETWTELSPAPDLKGFKPLRPPERFPNVNPSPEGIHGDTFHEILGLGSHMLFLGETWNISPPAL